MTEKKCEIKQLELEIKNLKFKYARSIDELIDLQRNTYYSEKPIDQEIRIVYFKQLIPLLRDQIIKKDAEIADLKDQIKKLKLLASYSKNFSEMGQS